MSHTVTILRLPSEDSDNLDYEFGGTHDDRCHFYKPCRKDWHRHPVSEKFEDEGEWSTKRAGPHAFLEGEWMVPADTDKDGCALRFVFEGWTPEETLEGIALGETRDVECEWDGEWWGLRVHEPTNSETGADRG